MLLQSVEGVVFCHTGEVIRCACLRRVEFCASMRGGRISVGEGSSKRGGFLMSFGSCLAVEEAGLSLGLSLVFFRLCLVGEARHPRGTKPGLVKLYTITPFSRQ